jgi:hypothetical protein
MAFSRRISSGFDMPKSKSTIFRSDWQRYAINLSDCSSTDVHRTFFRIPPTIKSLGIRYLTTLGIDISIPCRLSGISSGASSWERVAMKVVRPWPPTVGSKCEQGCQILNGFTLCRDDIA